MRGSNSTSSSGGFQAVGVMEHRNADGWLIVRCTSTELIGSNNEKQYDKQRMILCEDVRFDKTLPFFYRAGGTPKSLKWEIVYLTTRNSARRSTKTIINSIRRTIKWLKHRLSPPNSTKM
jgi:hypothetical protein